MSKEQMLWAKQHDWFLRSTLRHDGTYIIYARHDVPNPCNRLDCVEFTSFNLLTNWAGY